MEGFVVRGRGTAFFQEKRNKVIRTTFAGGLTRIPLASQFFENMGGAAAAFSCLIGRTRLGKRIRIQLSFRTHYLYIHGRNPVHRLFQALLLPIYSCSFSRVFPGLSGSSFSVRLFGRLATGDGFRMVPCPAYWGSGPKETLGLIGEAKIKEFPLDRIE